MDVNLFYIFRLVTLTSNLTFRAFDHSKLQKDFMIGQTEIALEHLLIQYNGESMICYRLIN